MSQEKRVLNFHLQNDSTEDIQCQSQSFLTNSILEDKSQWSASIVKFRLPCSRLKMWKQRVTADDYALTIAPPIHPYGLNVEQPLFTDSEYPCYSLTDFKNNVNLSFLKAYYALLQQVGSTSFPKVVHGQTDNFDGTNGVSFTHTSSSDYTGYVEVIINSITKNSGDNKSIKCTLKNPSGTICDIVTSTFGDLSTPITFTDTSVNSSPQSQTFPTDKTNYRTQEGTMKFSDESPNGQWTINFKSVDHSVLDHDIDWEVHIQDVLKDDAGSFPNYPPTLSINEESGFLSLNVHELYLSRNINIGFTKKMSHMLGFDCKELWLGGYEMIEYPHINRSAGLDQIVVITQEYPTSDRISNIRDIQISSNSITTMNEMNEDDSTSDIITSFTPDTSQTISKLSYDTDAGNVPWRSYRLQGNNSMSTTDVRVFVRRTNGDREIHQLAPGESFDMSVLFSKNN